MRHTCNILRNGLLKENNGENTVGGKMYLTRVRSLVPNRPSTGSVLAPLGQVGKEERCIRIAQRPKTCPGADCTGLPPSIATAR
jgi:hypothetical protein